jgi:hypothetical protein
LAEFRSSARAQFGRACIGIVLMMVGVAILFAYLVGLLMGHLRPEQLHSVLFGLMFLAGGGRVLFVSARRSTPTAVDVCMEGLVFQEGTTTVAFRWSDVLTVTEKRSVGDEERRRDSLVNELRAFRIGLQSGQVIILKSYIGRLGKLGTLIKENTLPHLLRRYCADLNQGRSVVFGALRLSVDGLTVQDRLLPWQQVRSVKCKGGLIKLCRRDRWMTWRIVKLTDVPNAHVLLPLVEQVTAEVQVRS